MEPRAELRASARLCWWSPDSLEQIKRAVSRSSKFSNQRLCFSSMCAKKFSLSSWQSCVEVYTVGNKEKKTITQPGIQGLLVLAISPRWDNWVLSAKRILPCTLKNQQREGKNKKCSKPPTRWGRDQIYPGRDQLPQGVPSSIQQNLHGIRCSRSTLWYTLT